MAYGSLNQNQMSVLRDFVSGKRVHDLGAGDLYLASVLVELGASNVVSVDRKTPRLKRFPDKVNFRQCEFSNFKDSISIAFLSWPSAVESPGLLELLDEAEIVIYLGKNTDGTICGFPKMFENLRCRTVVGYMPERANTLIVYGPLLESSRPSLPEEYAGVFQNLERPFGYDELMKARLLDAGETYAGV